MLAGLLLFYAGYRLLETRMFRPLGAAEEVTVRVAAGDLRVQDQSISQVGGGPLTDSLRSMVASLTRLVSAIRSSADDAAALGEEISAATEQMTSSTQEVAATTQELTDRATKQAATVRIVADDAARILAIAQDLAAGALQATERNGALVRLAEKHRGGLRAERERVVAPRRRSGAGNHRSGSARPGRRGDRAVHHPDRGRRETDPHPGAQRGDRGGARRGRRTGIHGRRGRGAAACGAGR